MDKAERKEMEKRKRKNEFDQKFRENEFKSCEKCFGYRIPQNKKEDRRVFPNYFSNCKWNDFRDNVLQEDLKKRYTKETKEYTVNGTLCPPKMASVASSSRLTYYTFCVDDTAKDRKKYRTEYGIKRLAVLFEKLYPNEKLPQDGILTMEADCPIKNGKSIIATAHPDIYYSAEARVLYVECKCHELFDDHTPEWKMQYLKSGRIGDGPSSINLKERITLYYPEGDICSEREVKTAPHKRKKKEYLSITIKDLNELSRLDLSKYSDLYFDFKQLTCHLLGIADQNEKNKKIDLIYLYFIPKAIAKEFEKEYGVLEKQFIAFCQSDPISSFCKDHNISISLVYAINDQGEDFKPEVKYPKKN